MSVEVHYLEMLQGEKVINTVANISKKIGILTDVNTYVEDAYRMPVNTNNVRKAGFPPVLVVKFKSTEVRREWLDRKKVSGMTSGNINNNNNNGKIRIFEKLTPYYRTLFWKMKETAKEINYQYTWTRNGKIFTKKCDNQGTVRIYNDKDIETLVKCHNNISIIEK
jgi:hypothetical protein